MMRKWALADNNLSISDKQLKRGVSVAWKISWNAKKHISAIDLCKRHCKVSNVSLPIKISPQPTFKQARAITVFHVFDNNTEHVGVVKALWDFRATQKSKYGCIFYEGEVMSISAAGCLVKQKHEFKKTGILKDLNKITTSGPLFWHIFGSGETIERWIYMRSSKTVRYLKAIKYFKKRFSDSVIITSQHHKNVVERTLALGIFRDESLSSTIFPSLKKVNQTADVASHAESFKIPNVLRLKPSEHFLKSRLRCERMPKATTFVCGRKYIVVRDDDESIH